MNSFPERAPLRYVEITAIDAHERARLVAWLDLLPAHVQRRMGLRTQLGVLGENVIIFRDCVQLSSCVGVLL